MSGTAARRGYLLVDHGSRREEANALLERVAEALRARVDGVVCTAHLEIAAPDLADGIDACVEQGVGELLVLPWFLGPGRHTARDIPSQLAAVRARHPSLRVRVAEPLGLHEKLLDVLLERAENALEVE